MALTLFTCLFLGGGGVSAYCPVARFSSARHHATAFPFLSKHRYIITIPKTNHTISHIILLPDNRSQHHCGVQYHPVASAHRQTSQSVSHPHFPGASTSLKHPNSLTHQSSPLPESLHEVHSDAFSSTVQDKIIHAFSRAGCRSPLPPSRKIQPRSKKGSLELAGAIRSMLCTFPHHVGH